MEPQLRIQSVHVEKPIDGADGEAIECLARYMSRAALSVERIHYHAGEQTVTVDAGKSQAGSRNYPEDFEPRYGFLRKEVHSAVFSFLECGIPENGVARVRCISFGQNELCRNKCS